MQRATRRRATSAGSIRRAPSADLGSHSLRAAALGDTARCVQELRDSRRRLSRPPGFSRNIGRPRPASRSGGTLDPEAIRSAHTSVLGREQPECPVVESRASDTPCGARGGASHPAPREDGCHPATARGDGDPSAPGRTDERLLARFGMAWRVDGSGRPHRARGFSRSRVSELRPRPRRSLESVRPPPERARAADLGSTTTNASLSPPDFRCTRWTRAVSSRPRRDRPGRRLRQRLQLLPRLSPGDRLFTSRVLASPAPATLAARFPVTTCSVPAARPHRGCSRVPSEPAGAGPASPHEGDARGGTQEAPASSLSVRGSAR